MSKRNFLHYLLPDASGKLSYLYSKNVLFELNKDGQLSRKLDYFNRQIRYKGIVIKRFYYQINCMKIV